jgi:hypothetical protein
LKDGGTTASWPRVSSTKHRMASLVGCGCKVGTSSSFRKAVIRPSVSVGRSATSSSPAAIHTAHGARLTRRWSRTSAIGGATSEMAATRSHASAGTHDGASPAAVLRCGATKAAGGTGFSAASVRTAKKVENRSFCLVTSENETDTRNSGKT